MSPQHAPIARQASRSKASAAHRSSSRRRAQPGFVGSSNVSRRLSISRPIERRIGIYHRSNRMAANIAHPPITSREEWLTARKALLTKEKQLTKERDALNAARRRLPMVRIDKDYTFEGPDGKKSLLDLFDGRHQLIVYHFMFDPAWENGCPGCTGL